jgi:metal transporter CNNM
MGLNKILGEETPYSFSRKELAHVIEEHNNSGHDSIDSDEKRIMQGALLFSNKKVGDVMTPATVVAMFSRNDILNAEKMTELKNSGHSRFPIFGDDRNSIEGILYIKDLIGIDDETEKTLGDYMDKEIYFVHPKAVLDDVFNAFLKTRIHLFMVRDEFGMFLGVISIEDIVEEIVGTEIVDEFDTAIDMRKEALRKNNKNETQ